MQCKASQQLTCTAVMHTPSKPASWVVLVCATSLAPCKSAGACFWSLRQCCSLGSPRLFLFKLRTFEVLQKHELSAVLLCCKRNDMRTQERNMQRSYVPPPPPPPLSEGPPHTHTHAAVVGRLVRQLSWQCCTGSVPANTPPLVCLCLDFVCTHCCLVSVGNCSSLPQ